MKTKRRFFKRILEPALEGKDKTLSRISVIIVIITGFLYTTIAGYNIIARHSGWLYRNLGGAVMFGFIISTVGVGLILTRPPKQRLFWAILFISLYHPCVFAYIIFLIHKCSYSLAIKNKNDLKPNEFNKKLNKPGSPQSYTESSTHRVSQSLT